MKYLSPKVALLSVAVATLLAAMYLIVVFTFFDYRDAKLKHVGTIKVDPDIATYIGDRRFIFRESGKNIKGTIEYCLFGGTPRCNERRGVNATHIKPKYPDWKLTWILEPNLSEDKLYLLCYGCSINYIKYYYHSKYNDPTDSGMYKVESYDIDSLPETESIRIYEIDVKIYFDN